MKTNLEFYEEQRLNTWRVWVLVAVSNLCFSYGIVLLILEKPFDGKPTSVVALVAAGLLMILISAVLLRSKLVTAIDSEGVYVRYSPFLKGRFFGWDEISEACVRKYRALKNFSGTGGLIFYRIITKEKVYVVSSRYGLHLKLKNGKKILIGTRQPGEIEELLKKIMSTQQFPLS